MSTGRRVEGLSGQPVDGVGLEPDTTGVGVDVRAVQLVALDAGQEALGVELAAEGLAALPPVGLTPAGLPPPGRQLADRSHGKARLSFVWVGCSVAPLSGSAVGCSGCTTSSRRTDLPGGA